MKNNLTIRVGALSCAAALLLTGCATAPQNKTEESPQVTTESAPATNQTQEQTSAPAENTEQTDTGETGETMVTREADGTVKLGDISVSAPETWEETPAEGLSETWKVGLDDDPSNPKVRLRVAPVFGDTPHPDMAEAELFGLAQAGGLYGEGFKANNRRDEDLKGAKKGYVTDFEYDANDGSKMVGRWWFFQHPVTNNVTAVEIVGNEDTLTDELLQQIDQSLELKTQ
ncbi:hypothetical protein [Micrococcoides hystricis]|uniref:Lipoprotein n=1 Tax=Micrococcoides hystricis TaxID=1572761 RepID=A0ABV6PBF6_9MICC